MQPEEVIAKVKEKAKANFRAGLNCAESVFEAFYLRGGRRTPA